MTIHPTDDETAAVVHQASVPDADVVSCGGVGKEAFLPADVTCPVCQKLNDRAVVHDSHAIPPNDEAVAALARLGDAYAEPAKTHDLWVDRRNGNVVIAVERETDVHRVYLQEGVARDLGYVLAPLTPAQRQLLIDDLTGGER